MRERVARAIFEVQPQRRLYPAWEDADEATQELWLRDADAAIESMGLRQEEVWSAQPGAQPLPPLRIEHDGVYARDALGNEYPFQPTDEEMRAAGYTKQARWVSDWEEV